MFSILYNKVPHLSLLYSNNFTAFFFNNALSKISFFFFFYLSRLLSRTSGFLNSVNVFNFRVTIKNSPTRNSFNNTKKIKNRMMIIVIKIYNLLYNLALPCFLNKEIRRFTKTNYNLIIFNCFFFFLWKKIVHDRQ